jgi:uncharacterized membrane protein
VLQNKSFSSQFTLNEFWDGFVWWFVMNVVLVVLIVLLLVVLIAVFLMLRIYKKISYWSVNKIDDVDNNS